LPDQGLCCQPSSESGSRLESRRRGEGKQRRWQLEAKDTKSVDDEDAGDDSGDESGSKDTVSSFVLFRSISGYRAVAHDVC